MISPYTDPKHVEAFDSCSSDTKIAFTGSGCSYIPGIPTWIDFLMALNENLNADVDVKSFTDKDQFYEAASAIFEAAETPEAFYNGIADLIVESTKTDFIAMHSSIWSLFDRVVTTNYDHCFEAALEAHNRPLINKGHEGYSFHYQQLPDLDFDTFCSTDKSLAYMHGRAGSQSIVLRREDYQKYYPSFYIDEHSEPSYNLEHFLEKNIGKFSFVFIGFSLEDEDFVRAFESFWEKYKEQLKNNPSISSQVGVRNHFIFLLNNQLKDWLNLQDIRNVELNVNTLIDNKILKYHPHDPERLIFQPNLNRTLEKAEFTPDEKASVIDLAEKVQGNKRKLAQLKSLNIYDIRIPGEDFNAISRFLNERSPIAGSAEQINVQDI
jgi:hypothetical protein